MGSTVRSRKSNAGPLRDKIHTTKCRSGRRALPLASTETGIFDQNTGPKATKDDGDNECVPPEPTAACVGLSSYGEERTRLYGFYVQKLGQTANRSRFTSTPLYTQYTNPRLTYILRIRLL